MWLVLASSTDASALWVYQGLQALGITPLQFVSAESLGSVRHWEHRLGSDGATIKMILEDGRTLCGSRIRGVVNRLVSAPLNELYRAAPPDRDYAAQEMLALYMSWLHALPKPMLNRPTPQGLSGRWRHCSEWAWLASRAGLPVEVYRQRGTDPPEMGYRTLAPPDRPVASAIVCGGRTFGTDLPSEIASGCQSLAELAEIDLLGVEFYSSASHPHTFASASPMPDLRPGGWPLIQSIGQILRNGAGKT